MYWQLVVWVLTPGNRAKLVIEHSKKLLYGIGNW